MKEIGYRKPKTLFDNPKKETKSLKKVKRAF